VLNRVEDGETGGKININISALISGGSRGWGGGFVGFGRTPLPLRPGVVVENARTAWLYQSSSVRDIFTEIVPQLYTTSLTV